MIEVFDLQSKDGAGKPCSRSFLDIETNSFDFISHDTICIADSKSNLLILKNIFDKDKIMMHVVKTKFNRIREIKSSEHGFLAAIT